MTRKVYILLLFFLSFYFSSAQFINTIAGNGNAGYSGDGGQAVNSTLNFPCAVAADKYGNIYISDKDNHVIRKISTNGVISRYAGTGSAGSTGDGGPANQAKLNQPRGIHLDNNGNLYIADRENHKIRMVNSSGIISTVAGSGSYGHSGDGGPATSAAFRFPGDVTVDDNGNMYICDVNNQVIRKVNSSGVISTIAGTVTTNGYTGDGGNAINATFNLPYGIAVDKQGNIFIADMNNHAIRKINTSGIISTYAGDGTGATVDGVAPNKTHIYFPTDVFIDAFGNMIICEFLYPRIRKVNNSGIINTIAGNGNPGFKGDGNLATSSQINDATGVTADKYGNVYIADRENHRIRKINAPAPEISVKGNNVTILDGDNSPTSGDNTHFGTIKYPNSVEKTFRIFNTGTDTLRISGLSVSGDFSIQKYTYPVKIKPNDSLSIKVTFKPTAFGNRTTSLNIMSNDIDESLYDFSLLGICLSGEIVVRGKNINIPDNDSIPVVQNNTNFGSLKLSGEIIRTFKIINVGNDTLTLQNISVSGKDSNDFKINSFTLPKKLNAKDSVSLLITFKPESLGNKEAKIIITNNDIDEPDYDFSINGMALGPKIVIKGNLLNIENNDTTPMVADHTDFGTIKLPLSKQLSFKILNNGNDTLKIESVNCFGTDFMDFKLQDNYNFKNIIEGDSLTINVLFKPFEFGTKSIYLLIKTNDINDSIYKFKIQGTGIYPQIEVKGNSLILTSGANVTSAANFTNFGISKGFVPVKKTYKIINKGNDSLKINSIIFTGKNLSEFIIQNITFPFTIGIFDSTTFDVLFTPKDTGYKSARIIIGNTDQKTSEYNFAIDAYSMSPIINVKGNNMMIADGDLTTSVNDSTHFGFTLSAFSLTVRYSIINNGNDSLRISDINFTGTNASEFAIENLSFPIQIAPNENSSFKVIFTPKVSGNRSAMVNIINDDNKKGVYNFAVQGESTYNAFVNPIHPVLPFIIYPNPVRDMFYFNSSSELSVRLFNVSGQKVFDESCLNFVDVSKLKNGIYFAQFAKEGIVLGRQKIVISK